MPFEMTMTMFWLIAMVFFLVVEAVTVGLVCIWFAAGSCPHTYIHTYRQNAAIRLLAKPYLYYLAFFLP